MIYGELDLVSSLHCTTHFAMVRGELELAHNLLCRTRHVPPLARGTADGVQPVISIQYSNSKMIATVNTPGACVINLKLPINAKL